MTRRFSRYVWIIWANSSNRQRKSLSLKTSFSHAIGILRHKFDRNESVVPRRGYTRNWDNGLKYLCTFHFIIISLNKYCIVLLYNTDFFYNSCLGDFVELVNRECGALPHCTIFVCTFYLHVFLLLRVFFAKYFGYLYSSYVISDVSNSGTMADDELNETRLFYT